MSQVYIRGQIEGEAEPTWAVRDGDAVTALDRAPWQGAKPVGKSVAYQKVKLLAPVQPTKIVCIGLNYQAHVAASQSADKAPENPLVFLKPPSSIIGEGDDIVHPTQSERVDYEAELGVVIGRTACKVDAKRAMAYVFGFTCVNDVTARDLQKKDGQWSRAKGFDTFCPVGPEIVTDVDWRDLAVEGILNGQVMQSGRTSQMIFDLPFLVSYISSFMTLFPGDLISTGTPSGIAPMKPGDKIEVKIENVGCLTNQVVGT
jgi:2-keto-4-pentenoate hydratase/2-oxohepta-3-ene-1,7-dioic acid hydratase in catechol pathway